MIEVFHRTRAFRDAHTRSTATNAERCPCCRRLLGSTTVRVAIRDRCAFLRCSCGEVLYEGCRK